VGPRNPTRAAVVYPILLDDRLELLVSRASGLERYTVPVGAERVTAEVRSLRHYLGKRSTHQYRRPAEQLYEWLVRPYAEDLESIDTLVFVPGGPLLTIPMAALHDGERFLIERYALAVTPSLSLLDPKPFDRAHARLLVAGLSEDVEGFAALPRVADEVAGVQALYGGDLLLNEDFVQGRLEMELAEERPSIVHVASHANFTGDPETSFLLTHDGPVRFNELGAMIANSRFGKDPLELLMLSACSTAAGDDRAALGLAGVAIRAGARSAVGTLWPIRDEPAYELVMAFYRALRAPGVQRADALRRAQQKLLDNPIFAHPFYWSPFLLIGNWL